MGPSPVGVICRLEARCPLRSAANAALCDADCAGGGVASGSSEIFQKLLSVLRRQKNGDARAMFLGTHTRLVTSI